MINSLNTPRYTTRKRCIPNMYLEDRTGVRGGGGGSALARFTNGKKRDARITDHENKQVMTMRISLTFLLVKVLEKLAASHISFFINSRNLLSDHQFSFRTGSSYTSQLIHRFHTWASVWIRAN